MKYIPIPFSTLKVQALLSNCKTQERRLRGLDSVNYNPDRWRFYKYVEKKGVLYAYFDQENSSEIQIVKCPYGIKGDRLWVQESYTIGFSSVCQNGIEDALYEILYKSDKESKILEYKGKSSDDPCIKDYDKQRYNWNSPLYMKKKYSRITLENTVNPRIERLLDISDADAIKEGFKSAYEMVVYFSDLNGEKELRKNPYVWVTEFKKVRGYESLIYPT